MPGRDGTGPTGLGSMTGRGLGPCNGTGEAYRGAGFGRGCGRGRGLGLGFFRGFSEFNASPKKQKELLQDQKNVLKNRLEEIDKQMEDLK
ncbi:MAG TPA: DUF5320 domain-containing protein [Bacillota bacterium]|nr:DUF5320 domain-containing protein [Bacillota bacterium]